MTRSKAGQNPPTRDSADVPAHEATPVIRDGPEGYSEDGSIRRSEKDKTKEPSADSANTSGKSKAKNYRGQDTVTGRFGSGKRTSSDSPRTIKENLALSSSRFGSPFAYSSNQNKHDFFKGLLPESTCIVFDQVVAEASTLRERLLAGGALTNDGSNGQFCVLKEREFPSINSDSSKESKHDDSKLQFYCFGPSGDDELELLLFVDPSAAANRRTYVVGDNSVDSIDSSDPSSTTSESSKAGKSLEARRVRNSKTGEVEYFVVNNGLDIFSINGTDVGPTTRAGPLPDFAVLEHGHFSIFWWRTAAALDYIPSQKRKRQSEDSDGESFRKAFKGATDPSHNSQVFPESKSWLDEYRRRVELCEERPIKYTSSITDLHPPHQQRDDEMRDIDVILAIGAVWLGLMNANIDFAYANSDLFSFARSMRMVGMHAIKGTNPFLMPLIFSKELEALSPELGEDTAEPLEPVFSVFQRGEEQKNQENVVAAKKAQQKDPGNKNKPPLPLEDQNMENKRYKGDIGHFVLAIAEKVNRDGANTIKDIRMKKALVRLRFMDSAEGLLDKGLIRRVARNIVRNAGWLGDIWPSFDPNEEDWVDVLGQSVNRCGEHTVLNAWAYMLEIPLAATRKGALAKASYEDIRRMIGLALRGQLDSLTIRAWMQHYKFAISEPLSQLQQTQKQNPDLPNKLRYMQTVALNEKAFNEIVDDMHTQEQAANRDHARIWGAVSVPPGCATTQQSGHAPEVATGFTLPLPGQGSAAGSSDTCGGSDSSSGSSDASGDSGSSSGSADTPPPPPASLQTPGTWKESLVRGLASHIALRAKNPRTTKGALKDATIIRDSSNMADYEVILGIAPIWESLKRLRRADFDFTYAGMDIFSPGGKQEEVGAVGGWSRFIMPLFFSSTTSEALEDQVKGQERIHPAGHLLLCVAELVDARPMTVQLRIFDSRRGTVTEEQIALSAERIINRSRWLGSAGPLIQVLYRPCIWNRVPQQVGINTCGLHVIFNAWATMLGIPIHTEILRRGRSREEENDATDQRFLAQGLEIVNLALEGFMDSTTIQAFFNVYGYSVEQRFRDSARSVIPVKAIGMNQDKFGRTLRKRVWSSKLEYAGARMETFPDATMAGLVAQGLSRDQAWTALAIAGGNSDGAFHWHYAQDVAGELPKPEEALSPKTPKTPTWGQEL